MTVKRPLSCPDCEYPLEGLVRDCGVRCPECGRTYTRAQLTSESEDRRLRLDLRTCLLLLLTPVILIVVEGPVHYGFNPTISILPLAWAIAVLLWHSISSARIRRVRPSPVMLVLGAPLLGIFVLLMSLLVLVLLIVLPFGT